jgi:hypothetical protein
MESKKRIEATHEVPYWGEAFLMFISWFFKIRGSHCFQVATKAFPQVPVAVAICKHIAKIKPLLMVVLHPTVAVMMSSQTLKKSILILA